jgi:hypothetical protein
VNGDGIADLVIGAPGAGISVRGGKNYGAGKTYVVFGKTSGFAANIDLLTLDVADGFLVRGSTAEAHSGYSVAGAGDVNGDGIADLVIGAPSWPFDYSTGSAYVLFGKASGFRKSIKLSSLQGTNGFRLKSVANDNDYAGYSVAGAGDVNGDGIADLVIGAPQADPGRKRVNAGSTFVVYGKSDGFDAEIDLSSLDRRNGFRIDGPACCDQAGRSVASAGDVNGDGIADLIIGAQAATFVVFGNTAGFPAHIDLSSLDGTNGFRIDVGGSIAGAGDVNGDGIADLVIGALGADPNGKLDAGSTYVVFGTASGFPKQINVSSLDGVDGFRIDGATASAESGWSVAAGDVNGDGVADVIISARGIAKTFVVFGRR